VDAHRSAFLSAPVPIAESDDALIVRLYEFKFGQLETRTILRATIASTER
jgi:hypothetical protein